MRTLCFVLLVASIFIASEATINAKVDSKRLLLDGLDGLLNVVTGNILGDLANVVNNLLTQTLNVLNNILGGNGVVGGLLNKVLGIDIVGGIVGGLHLDGVLKAVDNLVIALVQDIAKVVKDLLAALQGVNLSDTT